MYTDASGVQIPTGTDAFSPTAQFKTWQDKNATYNNRVIVNLDSDRTALAAPVLRDGLECYVQTTDTTWLYEGTTWRVIIEDTGWITATLGAGWGIISGETVKYRRVNGQVFLTGRASRGSGSTPAFTLPGGFTPAQQLVFMAEANGASVRASIPTTGELPGTIGSGAVSALSFSSFPRFLVD